MVAHIDINAETINGSDKFKDSVKTQSDEEFERAMMIGYCSKYDMLKSINIKNATNEELKYLQNKVMALEQKGQYVVLSKLSIQFVLKMVDKHIFQGSVKTYLNYEEMETGLTPDEVLCLVDDQIIPTLKGNIFFVSGVGMILNMLSKNMKILPQVVRDDVVGSVSAPKAPSVQGVPPEPPMTISTTFNSPKTNSLNSGLTVTQFLSNPNDALRSTINKFKEYNQTIKVSNNEENNDELENNNKSAVSKNKIVVLENIKMKSKTRSKNSILRVSVKSQPIKSKLSDRNNSQLSKTSVRNISQISKTSSIRNKSLSIRNNSQISTLSVRNDSQFSKTSSVRKHSVDSLISISKTPPNRNDSEISNITVSQQQKLNQKSSIRSHSEISDYDRYDLESDQNDDDFSENEDDEIMSADVNNNQTIQIEHTDIDMVEEIVEIEDDYKDNTNEKTSNKSPQIIIENRPKNSKTFASDFFQLIQSNGSHKNENKSNVGFIYYSEDEE